MEDNQIVDLYWARLETAISETEHKYSKYCHYIAYNILYDDEDTKECVNDTYMRAWHAMPPKRPERLSAFLGKITRNLALNQLEKRKAEKRGGGQMMPLVFDELEEVIPTSSVMEQVVDDIILVELLNRFLEQLQPKTRRIFMRRYWYLSSIKEIATSYNMSESKVKMSLLRARNALRHVLEKEGIGL